MSVPVPGGTDSAGVPWAGRTLQPNAFAGDDGTVPAGCAAALARWAAATGARERLRAAQEVVAVLAGVRVFAPVVAVLGEAEVVAAGPAGDKSADMALAVLTRPDGRRALPLFTALDRLAAWRPDARPVPVAMDRAALAGVQERCEALVLDPAGPVRFVVPRPALWALAQRRPWVPSPFDPEVVDAAVRLLGAVPGVRGVRAAAGESAELLLEVAVVPGLDREALTALTGRAQQLLAAEPLLTERVTSLQLRLRPADYGPSGDRPAGDRPTPE